MADTSYSFRLTGDMASLTRSATGAHRSVSDLALRADGLAVTLAKAGTIADGFAGSVAALGARLAVPVALATAAATAVAGFATRVAEGIDPLNDLADSTGSTVELLSALEDVGARTGTAFDTVGGILTKFNNVLKEADGKNAVSRVLKELNLDVEELRRADPAEALRLTAVALSGYADNGAKARVIQELFGKSVRDAAPFLADLAKKTELVGTVTGEQARQAEAFAQQLASLQKNALDLSRAVAGPLIESFNRFFSGVKAYGGALEYLKDNFRFDQAAPGGAGLAGTNAEIAGIEKRLQRIDGFSQRAGLSDVLQRRYAAERGELEAQLETLRKRQTYILGRSADPSGGSTELARRGRLPGTLSDLGPAEKEKKPKAEPRDFLEEADRRMQEALERYIERDIALEQKLTERKRDEAAKRLEQSQQFGLQLLDQTQVLGASLITDERARGAALIEIDRQRITEQIAAFQLGTEEQQRLTDLLADNIVARYAQLDEQLKPQWQRMVEGWADTQRAMKAASDEFRLDFLRTAEDTFVQFVKTGEFSLDRLGDLLLEFAARQAFQQAFGSLANSAGGFIASLITGSGGTAAGAGTITGGTGLTLGASGGGLSFGGGLASGGSVERGSFYKVNEEGPELYTSGGNTWLMNPEAGQVSPLQRAAASGGGADARSGGNVYITVENNSGGRVRTSETTNGMDRYVKIIVDQAVAEVDRRIAAGGSTDRVLSATYGMSRATTRRY